MTPTDLNTILPSGAGTAMAARADIGEKIYDPTRDRETIRGTIAQALVWTLVGVIGCVMLTGLFTIYSCRGEAACSQAAIDLKAIRTVIELVFTPLLGLVGAVTGFYFGEKSGAARAAG